LDDDVDDDDEDDDADDSDDDGDDFGYIGVARNLHTSGSYPSTSRV
uniref:Uncharacterized protein n=1 Tax=Echinostoma caproni TaxID=27848 RepID=A0A183BE06_9TREM